MLIPPQPVVDERQTLRICRCERMTALPPLTLTPSPKTSRTRFFFLKNGMTSPIIIQGEVISVMVRLQCQTSSSKSSFFSHPMRAASFSEAPQVWCCLLDFRRPASAEVNSLRQITASLDLGRFQALYEHYHFIGIDHHLLSTFPFLDFVDNLGTAEIKP